MSAAGVDGAYARADDQTTGTIESTDAHYELLQPWPMRIQCQRGRSPGFSLDKKTGLEQYEARNAAHIGGWTGAGTYAADTLPKTEVSLQNAGDESIGKIGKRLHRRIREMQRKRQKMHA